MCLVYSEASTKSLEARMRGNGGKLTCWKVYDVEKGRLCALIHTHRASSGGEVTHGEIVSNRMRQSPGADAEDSKTLGVCVINRGIHVYTDRDSADATEWQADAVVPVQCDVDDLVGAGHGEAVFMKVHLLRKDFDAAVKGNGNA